MEKIILQKEINTLEKKGEDKKRKLTVSKKPANLSIKNLESKKIISNSLNITKEPSKKIIIQNWFSWCNTKDFK